MIDRSQDGMIKTRNDKCLRKYKNFSYITKVFFLFREKLWRIEFVCATLGHTHWRTVWETFPCAPMGPYQLRKHRITAVVGGGSDDGGESSREMDTKP